MHTAQPPTIRYLTLQASNANRRSQKLLSNFSRIAALLEESKAKFLHGYQPLDGRAALPVDILFVLRLPMRFRVASKNSHGCFVCFGHETSLLRILPGAPKPKPSQCRKHRQRL